MREDEVSQSHRDFLESLPDSLESTTVWITLCYYRSKAFQSIHSFIKYLLETSYIYMFA